MKYQFSILFCFIMLLFEGCMSGKSVFSKKSNWRHDFSLFAWNEDTTNSYLFAVENNNEFVYTITKKNSEKRKEHYNGIVTNQLFSDTIFLKYKRNVQPGVTNYLTTEASGGYLIQSFENNTKRVFMRIQRLGHRF